jgi:hypothetical protein
MKATVALLLEGLGVMLATVGVFGAAGVFAAVLERKSTNEVTRWGQWGTAIGFAVGVPLTICTFVLLQRYS